MLCLWLQPYREHWETLEQCLSSCPVSRQSVHALDERTIFSRSGTESDRKARQRQTGWWQSRWIKHLRSVSSVDSLTGKRILAFWYSIMGWADSLEGNRILVFWHSISGWADSLVGKRIFAFWYSMRVFQLLRKVRRVSNRSEWGILITSFTHPEEHNVL